MTNHNLNRKLLLSALAFLCFITCYGQIPPGYYNSANGLTGDQLKAALHNIIDGHTTYPYTSSGTDTWDILKEADRDPNNPNNVLGIYSGFSMDAAAEYAGGSGWSREHVWAKSRGDFGTTQGAGTDCHHLRAEDVSTNSARNNRNFDNADYFYNDSGGTYNGPTLSKTSDTDWIWEPPDAVKGDVARMIFYMVVRYEGTNGDPDLELTDTYQTSTSKEPLHARLTTLIQWHLNDPVDDPERSRNDIIYGYQQNRNPFIDHPEYVCEIYSSYCSANNAPTFTSTPITTADEGQAYTYNITTNDADGDPLTITAPTKPSWLILTDNGNGTASLSGTPGSGDVGANAVTLNVSDGVEPTPTAQSFTITVNAAGGGGGGPASDLFISEYIEGSSYNKGLEIANFTGTSVNLSQYSLQKQTNGSGGWGSELTLSGTLADGDVYVIVHSSAHASMQAVADLSTGSGVVTFNGNDPLGLFKSGSLIDAVGTFNDGSNFAQNVTLVRKSTVDSPNSTYTTSEWDQHPSDTFSFLGAHTFDGGTPPPSCDTPGGLTSSGITTSSANLSWNPSSGAVDYGLRYRVNGTSTWTDSNITGTSTTLTGLSESTTYEFQVRAQCSGSNSAYSASSTFTTSTAPCNTPGGLSSSGITSNAATVSWNAVSGANDYGLRYKVNGTSTWTDNTIAGTSSNLTGLTASTTYEYQVRSQCSSSNSAYSASSTFTTPAPPGMSCGSTVSAPYNEGFESGFGNWTNVGGDDFDWSRTSGGTPSNGTGPSSADEGSFYIYVESSSPNYSNKTAIIEGPCFDLSGLSSASLDFKYHLYGSNNMGSLDLQATTDDLNWTSIWSAAGNIGNSWQIASVDLASYIGTSVKLRLVGVTGTTWKGDMAIDNMSLSIGSGGGGASTNDVSLTIVLDNYPGETSWEIRNGGSVIASGGTYGGQSAGSTVVENVTLNDGCYDFIIYDSYGDGICCAYGNGSYSLVDGGTTLASGGSFGSSETTNFCVNAGARIASSDNNPVHDDEITKLVKPTFYPNPASSQLNIVAKIRNNMMVKIFTLSGKEILNSAFTSSEQPVINVDGIERGVYVMIIELDGTTHIEKLMIE